MNTRHLRRSALLVGAVLALAACTSSDGGSTPSGSYEALMPPADFPRMDGSTANIPLGRLVLQRTTGLDEVTAENSVQFNTTSAAYENLARGNADLLLAYEPDTETRAQVDPDGKHLEFSPIGRDALVFLTNESNPVKNLTSAQVRDIYTGKITNWSQVGGSDAPIAAFQRPEKSGSQALMRKLVMGDVQLADAPAELVAGEMGELVDGVAAYDNTGTALGYSVYYYVTNQYAVDGIRLMTIDGIAPTNKTIADGTYPWINDFYAVIRADEPSGSPARKVFEWLNTPAGRQTVTDAGYVALPAP